MHRFRSQNIFLKKDVLIQISEHIFERENFGDVKAEKAPYIL